MATEERQVDRAEVIEYLETIVSRLERVTDRLTAHEALHLALLKELGRHDSAPDA